MWPACISTALEIMTDIKWMLRKLICNQRRELFFTLAQVWLKVFFQQCNAKVGIKWVFNVRAHLFTHLHILWNSSNYYKQAQLGLIKSWSHSVKKVSHDSSSEEQSGVVYTPLKHTLNRSNVCVWEWTVQTATTAENHPVISHWVNLLFILSIKCISTLWIHLSKIMI